MKIRTKFILVICMVFVMSINSMTAFAATDTNVETKEQVGIELAQESRAKGTKGQMSFSYTSSFESTTLRITSDSTKVTYTGYIFGSDDGIVVLRFRNDSTYSSRTFICDGTEHTLNYSLDIGTYTVTVEAVNCDLVSFYAYFD